MALYERPISYDVVKLGEWEFNIEVDRMMNDLYHRVKYLHPGIHSVDASVIIKPRGVRNVNGNFLVEGGI